MNTRNTFSLFATVLLFVACSRSTPQQEMASAAIERVVKEVAISSGTPVTKVDISIDGMSCAMMCGGSIKKALAALPGVTSADIEFNEGDVTDHAIVTYDESQVTDAQMIEAIQKLHSGQYKVLAVQITKQVKAAGGTSGEAVEVKEENGINASIPVKAILPGVLAILTQILRH
jgi:copper chaperone CopZ